MHGENLKLIGVNLFDFGRV